MVEHMQAKSKHAFVCLEHLLDDQNTQQQMSDLLKYLPVFVLPVIKALSLPIFTDRKVMKILAKLVQILPLNLA
jgi:hypothetical protein